jgi:ribosome-associated protein
MKKSKSLEVSERLRDVINNAILNKKGDNLVNLDLRNIHNSITDFFVICNVNSDVQMQAIAEEVGRCAKEILQEQPFHKEGFENSQWILLDYFDVVVHIFKTEWREYYKLEQLWGDAEIVKIEPENVI